MKHCAFLSMENLDDFKCYDQLLVKPLAACGWQVQTIPWRQTSTDWNQFEAVIIRSPWDYQDEPEAFLKVIQTIEQSSAHLENSFDIIQWNFDKRYLKEMQAKDIPIVATQWYPHLTEEDIATLFSAFDAEEIIIKPVISANADDTYRLNPYTAHKLTNKLLRRFGDRPFMAQPFMENIIAEGEFSLFYFSGDYSHAILKKPAAGDFRVQEEHGGQLQRIDPETRLHTIGEKTMQALPEMPLYARVDFVRSRQNQFLLMELELIEPSLYFNMDPKSPLRFAKALDQRMASSA